MTDLGTAIAAALRRHGWTILARPARLDRRGAALADLCEAREDDRTWDPHWDQCPYRVIGYLDPGDPSRLARPPANEHDLTSVQRST